jgi:hypothetical protein
MNKSQFYRGFPISYSGVIYNTVNNDPINLTTISNFEIFTQSEFGQITQMTITPVNAANGAFTASIANTAELSIGNYEIQARYTDAAGVTHVSYIDQFEMKKAVFP